MSGAVLSMTGFGSAQLERSGAVVRAEIRTVNHRHLQVRMRLPSGHQSLEPQIEARIRQALQRGAVQVAVHFEAAGLAPDVEVNRDLARKYSVTLRGLAQELGMDETLSLSELAALPGVLQVREGQVDPEQQTAWMLEVLDGALEDLLGMRANEGASMVADLRLHARAIQTLIRSIAERSPEIVRHHQSKLRERVAALLEGSEGLSASDLAREVAVIADRLDVSEEVARLQAHLDQLEALLGAGGAIGRKLDFLAQEFMREANTIGSKCSDAETAHQIVELKALIERLREQVQNVE